MARTYFGGVLGGFVTSIVVRGWTGCGQGSCPVFRRLLMDRSEVLAGTLDLGAPMLSGPAFSSRIGSHEAHSRVCQTGLRFGGLEVKGGVCDG